jgi:antitoxin HicB
MKSKDNNPQHRFSFPALLTPDLDGGGYVVTFRDLPEAITQGDSVKVALQEAADCLEEAIAARIDDRLEIPQPSELLENEYLVTVPMQTALKAALTIAMSESQMNRIQLANALKVHAKEVRRILDPHHGTKLATMERTFNILGKKAVLSFVRED